MLWTYAILTIIVGSIISLLLYRSIKNRAIATLLIALTVLLTLGLITLCLKPYYSAWQFEKTLRSQNPFINLIAEKAPNEFNAYLAKIKNNIVSDGDTNNEIYYTSELINTLLIKYGPVASNESLYRYLKSDIEFNKKLFTIDPILVLFHEFPDKFLGKIDLNKYSANEFENNMLGAIEEVIQSGIESPQALPSNKDIDRAKTLFREILDKLSTKYGSATVLVALQTPENVSVNKKTAAEIIIALSEEILAKGQNDAGLLLKSSFIVNSQPK